MKYKVTLFCFVFAFAKANLSKAQNEIDNLLTDIVTITDQYVEPAAQAATMNSTAGWYHTASSLDTFKFTVAIHANVLVFPENKKTFTVSNSNFNNVSIRGSDTATIPTALGGEQRTFFDFTFMGDDYEFQAFEGVDIGFISYPFIQTNVGLWRETELILRYSPDVTINKSSYASYAAGVKHNIAQYFFKEDRPVDIALLASYSLFDLNLAFDPYELRSQNNATSLAVIDGAAVDAHAVLLQLIASKRYKNYTFSTGVAYNRSWVDYRLDGEQGFFLDLLNDLLTVLSDTQHSFKADLGATYHLKKWDLTAQLSAGQFFNLNLGGMYRLN